jgi:hypothetical protein
VVAQEEDPSRCSLIPKETVAMDTSQFAPISLGEMQAVRLMNRVDTKYALGLPLLEEILASLSASYRVQAIDGVTLADYRTVYLDTPLHDMYLLHHNGKKVRQKVRLREYVDSDLSWFEVKSKNNHGRTDKKRIPLASLGQYETRESAEFIGRNSSYALNDLVPQLGNSFRRVTLVNRALTERVTIDTEICFSNLRTGEVSDLSSLSVVEVKQAGSSFSAIKEAFFEQRIRPLNLSKYCIGMVLTDHQIKSNRFKAKLNALDKIAN